MSIVESIFDKDPAGNPLIVEWMFFTSIAVAIALGLIAAFCYMYRNMYSKTLVMTIAILPPFCSQRYLRAKVRFLWVYRLMLN